MRKSTLYNNILFSSENNVVLVENQRQREYVTVVNHMLSYMIIRYKRKMLRHFHCHFKDSSASFFLLTTN